MVLLSQKLLSGYETYSKVAAGVVIVFGLLVLVGWATNNQSLMDLCPTLGNAEALPFLGRVQSSAAISMILVSTSLLLLSIRKKSVIAFIVGEALAVISLIGAAIAAYVIKFSEDFEPFSCFQPTSDSLGISYPTPLTFEDAITMALLSIAAATIPLDRPVKTPVSQVIAIVSVLIPLLILLGASTRIEQLCALGGCFRMSIGVSVLAIIISSAIFLSRPDIGLAASYSSATTGSALLRRATLMFFIVPALLMARTLLVNSPGLYIADPVGWVVFVFVLLIVLGIFGASCVQVFNRVESELTGQLATMKNELERTVSPNGTPVGQVEMSGVTNFVVRYKRVCLMCTNEYDDSTEKCPVDSTPLSRVIDESLLGTVFAEKYDVISRLGSGGMSTVYRAKHRYFEKEVAIKVLKGNTADSSDGLKRFQREARATSAVTHPGIVGVSDFGLTPDGRAYLVMDYLEGESLSHFLDRVGRMPLEDVIDITTQLCDALTVAHEGGIVHRDLKPSNIMLVRGDDGETIAKIVDFGLAKILDEEHHASLKITQTGDCFGSPLYMSPEQCMGKKVDHRCDIYALGCIIFECLTGNPPIVGTNAAETITKHVQERPAPFPESLNVPKEIKLIIYKALHKEPMWRPQSVLEIKDALAGSLRKL